MEWGDIENRIVVVGLHICNMEKDDIFRTLRPLEVTRDFVYRAVKLFEDTGGVGDPQRSGRPRTVRAPKASKRSSALKEHIEDDIISITSSTESDRKRRKRAKEATSPITLTLIPEEEPIGSEGSNANSESSKGTRRQKK